MNSSCPCIFLLAEEIRSLSRARFAKNLKAALAEDLTHEWERGIRENRRRAKFEGDGAVRRLPQVCRPLPPIKERGRIPATWKTPKHLRRLARVQLPNHPPTSPESGSETELLQRKVYISAHGRSKGGYVG